MNCALCEAESREEISHVIPAFVYRWLKKSSPTGFLRAAVTPNLRMQDGPKLPLLGPKCEDLFCQWETQFAESIFHEVHQRKNSSLSFSYDDWLAKFCVATSWRSLRYLLESNPDKELPNGDERYAQEALQTWSSFLRGSSAAIAPHWQYFLILDAPTSVPNPNDKRDISVFIKRGVDIDTMHAAGECYIFTKMCEVLIVGTIRDENPKQWKGCKVGLSGGTYRCPQDFKVSSCFFSYVETAVQQIRAARAEISPQQLERMEAAFRKRQADKPA